ncbi:uncharacterized protein LOC111620822 [Centruroides sculpturatus]|uniref:uncharacterized protein LOC111620822 n=1 Tax=Centruroides sculpturatus TaxID=218467 RepID=UPI000C6F022C|nr:uncharacterized protein LOC111620822 [Centruroides sculpturatus]
MNGKTAYLPCRVRHLGDRTVSWIRRRDLHVLTVGRFTYTSDQRFQTIHLENSDDWTLQIKYPQKQDAGIYECQVSTVPKMSIFITLNVSWIRRRDLHVLTVGRFTYTSDQRFQTIHLENSDDWTLQIKYPQKQDAGIYECQVSTVPKMSIFITLNVVELTDQEHLNVSSRQNSQTWLPLEAIINYKGYGRIWK